MVQSLHDGKWFTLTGADFELPLETLARIAWNSMKKTEVDRLDPALQSVHHYSLFLCSTGQLTLHPALLLVVLPLRNRPSNIHW